MGAGRKEVIKQTVTYVAGGTIVANRFCMLNSSGEVIQATDGAEVKGVSMEAGASGASISVAVMNAGNIVRVAGTAAGITTGVQVASDLNGRAILAATGDFEVGQADESITTTLDDYAIINLTRGATA